MITQTSEPFRIIEKRLFSMDFQILVVSGRLLPLFLVHCLGVRFCAWHSVRFIKYIKTILTISLLAGVKPISIVGLAHKAVEQETLQKYWDTYPFLDSDIENLRARAGLLTLLVNHLIDLELFTKADAQACPPDVVMNEEVEMSTTHDADELAVEGSELVVLRPGRIQERTVVDIRGTRTIPVES
jgi:hypothetical protein